MLNPIYFNHLNKMYPIRIDYIFQHDHDSKDPIFRKIQEYCELFNIQIIVRQFNPRFIEEDREYIQRLPAFHMYENDVYADTFYTDDKPILHIRTVYDKFELKHLEYLAKKQIWNEKLNFMKRMFKRQSLKTDSQSSMKESISEILQDVNKQSNGV